MSHSERTVPAARLILASTSPRRIQILSLLGIPFKAIDPEIDEVIDPKSPSDEEAGRWALEKAAALKNRFPESIIIGGDTLIDLDGLKIGKPRDASEAMEILKKLRGRRHKVVSGVGALWPGGNTRKAVETVTIKMRPATDDELREYITTEEPLDKAGAYSIQGRGGKLIEAIEGDFLATVGFPLRTVSGILREAGLSLPVDVEAIYRERTFLNWKDFEPVSKLP